LKIANYITKLKTVNHIHALRIWVLLLLLFSKHSIGQDLHYSQYYNSPLNLNPALTGANADYRMVLNTRSQWKSVTVPYRTYSAAFDMKAIGIGTFHPNTGVGLMVNSDVDGDSHLRTTNINFTTGFQQTLDADSINIISIGVLLGYTQKSFDINGLSFNNQFTGDFFDPTAPTGEPVTDDKMGYFDLGIGLHGQLFKNETRQFQLGVALHHINRAKNSFYNSGNVKIMPRLTAYAHWQQQVNNVTIIPHLLYMRQNTLQQIHFGGHIQWHKFEKVSLLEAGVSYRWADAIVLQTGLGLKNLYVGLSYDINISQLTNASKGRGGFEAALIYKIYKIRPLAPSPPCIIY